MNRQHLIDRLDMRRHRPLTLVSAPAGYGKGTPLSCWLESCQGSSGWVSLDAKDSYLPTFMAIGFLGLFIGAVVLSVGYKLFAVWIEISEPV